MFLFRCKVRKKTCNHQIFFTKYDVFRGKNVDFMGYLPIFPTFFRKFLSKTARSQQYKHKIAFFRDQFSLLSLTDIASVGDSLTRNEIISSNEMRQHIGMKPSTDPNADVLRNKNIAPSEYNQYSGEPNAGGTETPVETEPPAEVLVSELE